LTKSVPGAVVARESKSCPEIMTNCGLLEALFGILPSVDEFVHRTAEGRRMLIIHGHQFDGSLASARLWKASPAYTMLLRINRWYNQGLYERGTGTGSLSSLKYRIKRAVEYFSDFNDRPVLEAARRNIPIYKRYRHLLHARAYHPFPPSGSPEGWQAVQFSDGEQAVVLCFRGKSTQSTLRLPVRGLRPTVTYKITTANEAAVRSITGDRLMRDGLIVSLPKPEMSNVFFLDSGTSHGLTAESPRA